mmetsp:Transcript_42471/g.134916  ORF Transcript_42471/g.134916 Transcript_42471/m.134916 type:complete len:209 (+) Transcript_42471:207-833(+)
MPLQVPSGFFTERTPLGAMGPKEEKILKRCKSFVSGGRPQMYNVLSSLLNFVPPGILPDISKACTSKSAVTSSDAAWPPFGLLFQSELSFQPPPPPPPPPPLFQPPPPPPFSPPPPPFWPGKAAMPVFLVPGASANWTLMGSSRPWGMLPFRPSLIVTASSTVWNRTKAAHLPPDPLAGRTLHCVTVPYWPKICSRLWLSMSEGSRLT